MIHKYKNRGLNIVLDVDSGAIITVDDLTYDILDFYKEKNSDEIVALLSEKYAPKDILEALDEIALLEADKVLFTEYHYDVQMYKNYDLIKAVCLHVAHDCNLKCNYCFASQGNFNGDPMLMSLEVGKKAIDFLIEQSKERKNLEVDFFGGEPLMNMDVVKALVDYARSKEEKYNKHFNFTITTNAVLLDEENRQYINDNMDNVVLSLDGRKEVHDFMRRTVNDQGSFDIIIDNIKKMVEMREASNKEYYVRGTFTHYNLDFSKDVEFMAQQGFKSISVEPVVGEEKYDYSFKDEDLEPILKEYDQLADDYLTRKERGVDYSFFHYNIDFEGGPCIYKRLSGCGAGRDYVAVTPEGDVYPCHQFVGDEKFKMGSVFTGINRPDIKEYFGKANLLEKEKCKTCWCHYYCGGGCHANAYNFNGTVMEPYEIACEMEQHRVEDAIAINILETSLDEQDN